MRRVSVDHYENFPVASWLCPAPLRPAVRTLYHFARTADDLADEGDLPAGQRLELLQRYRHDLIAAEAGQGGSATWPQVFGPLAGLLRSRRIQPTPLHDLLDAFESDVRHVGYGDRAALLGYCGKSAAPVGRLMLQLHGMTDGTLLSRSDAVCNALQLINFWQDLSRDLPRGRNYIPATDWARHGLTPQAALQAPGAPECRALVRDLCAWSRDLMLQGAPLARQLPGRIGWELRAIVAGGLQILAKIDAMNHLAFARRPRLGWTDSPALVLATLRAGRAPSARSIPA